MALLSIVVLVLAFSMPAGAFNGGGAGAGAGASGSAGIYTGGWNPSIYPYQQWQNPLWDNQYPFWDTSYPYMDNYKYRGWFSNCYSRCIGTGYGPDYCVQVCPV
ncbi:MAG: hypothetical protein A4E28_02134 [Methanocella sp. PtaU1.Bin125]|nr:MAG: hypothetical protein A4E28_02134 [Methanocella sp. PtaU1.Bin125]